MSETPRRHHLWFSAHSSHHRDPYKGVGGLNTYEKEIIRLIQGSIVPYSRAGASTLG